MILVIKLFKFTQLLKFNLLHMFNAQSANDGVKNWIMIGEYTKQLIFWVECIIILSLNNLRSHTLVSNNSLSGHRQVFKNSLTNPIFWLV